MNGRRSQLKNLAPAALLAAWGAAFGAVAFGLDTPAFDDHPGQLFRLWHVLARGPAPWAWNPDWWAGYPELQFYPPGFFYLGLLLHGASLGRLSTEAVYQALLWLAWLAPGLTAWWLLARRLGDGWLALPGAFVVLTLSGDFLASGVEGGVRVGMLPARLGWALLPLLPLALGRDSAERPPLARAAAVLLALLTLTHPAHLPAAAALLAVAAGQGVGPARRRWAGAALTLAAGVGLTAFWTLPLLARLAHTRALAWGELAPLAALARHPLLLVLLAGAVAAGRLAVSPEDRRLAAWPWAAGAVLLGLAVVEPLGIRWLPAHRVVDGTGLAFALAAGLAGGRGVAALAERLRLPAPAVAIATIALAVVAALPGGTLALWPRAAEWPALEPTRRGLRLDELWAALRSAPPGRVLFLRSGVPLRYGTEWWRPHTHVLALTPIHSGRAIVHGTFTHPSPVAALLYRGSAGAGAITSLVERLDGVTLFGRPLDALDPPTFNAYADRLGVSVVVGLDEDLPRLAALRDNPTFVRRRTIGPFVLWERTEPVAVPRPAGPGRWVLDVPPEPGAWVTTRTAFYPLWRVEHGGRPLPTRRGPAGDLEVRLDASGGPVELRYAEVDPFGAAGAALTVAALAALVIVRSGRARSRG
jgi:hypothetical protein